MYLHVYMQTWIVMKKIPLTLLAEFILPKETKKNVKETEKKVLQESFPLVYSKHNVRTMLLYSDFNNITHLQRWLKISQWWYLSQPSPKSPILMMGLTTSLLKSRCYLSWTRLQKLQ